jgi:hypothetical protein
MKPWIRNPKDQTSIHSFLHYNVGDINVRIRRDDIYMSATDVFKAFPDKRWSNYIKSESTLEFLIEYAYETQRPIGISVPGKLAISHCNERSSQLETSYEVSKRKLATSHCNKRSSQLETAYDVSKKRDPKKSGYVFLDFSPRDDPNRIPLIHILRNGRYDQGTWVDEMVAFDIATWIDPKFKIHVYRWYMETHKRVAQIESAYNEILITLPVWDSSITLKRVSDNFNGMVRKKTRETKGRKACQWDYCHANRKICLKFTGKNPKWFVEYAKAIGNISAKERSSGVQALYRLAPVRAVAMSLCKHYMSLGMREEDAEFLAWDLYSHVHTMCGLNRGMARYLEIEAISEVIPRGYLNP